MSMKKSPTMSQSLNKFEEPNGVVGLGIVAALNEKDPQKGPSLSKKKSAICMVSPKAASNPISIFSQSCQYHGKSFRKRPKSFEEMEMCEEYTCVITHVGNNLVKKREYFDGDFLGVVEGSAEELASVAFGSGFANAPAAMDDGCGGGDGGNVAAGFMDSCFLCKKKLHGFDIFIYRGEKAFCSAECRDKQISVDEHTDKYVSGMIKPSEHSASPCSSSPMQLVSGIAAA